ncbi:MAG: hypothetical protein U1D30_07510 [Planctomycetota bacterium]
MLLPRSFGTEAKPRVAAVITEFTHRSHAHVILENFLQPYLFNGRVVESPCEVVSMYVDQFPDGEMSRGISKEYGIPLFPTIAGALQVGGDSLAVDAVLSIGEHGKYPTNDRWQMMYPRKEFFDAIVAVFKESGKAVPVFNDKHLSYRWDWAKEMVDTSRAMGFALMAGSSVPLAQRRPPIEFPQGAVVEEAISIHGGGVESYDFHALEVLQSQIEFRAGGETGVKSVEFLEGDAFWKAGEQGRWSIPLAEAAMAAELGGGLPPLKELAQSEKIGPRPPHAILIEYVDGTRGAAMTMGSSATRWNFACKLKGDSKPLATSYYVGPWQNRNLFKALSHAIQDHFVHRRAPYPVERTLLVSGILDIAMDSRYEKGTKIDTPELNVRYEPIDFKAMREMGKSWEIITESTPEPMGLDSAKNHT